MARTLTRGHDVELELDLEPLPPQGFADFNPRPHHDPPEPVRLTPGWLALVAVGLAAVGVFAAYRASAINAIRAVERDRAAADILHKQRETLANRLLAGAVTDADAVAAAQANRELLREQRGRFFDLADHLTGVSSFDRNVRRLRDELVGALLRDAHDLDHAARGAVPDITPRLSGDYDDVDRLLQAARTRWSVDPAPPPSPPPLTAADETLARFGRVTDEPLGDASLLILRDDSLRLLHLNTAMPALLGRARFTNVVATPAFVMVSSLEGIDVIDVTTGQRRRIVEVHGRTPHRLVRAAEPGTVWLQREWEWGTPVERIDWHGKVLETAASHGVLQAAVGQRLLWYTRGADGPARATLAERDGRIVHRYEDREFLDASPGGVAWRLNGLDLAVTDGAGTTVTLTTGRGRLFLRDAAWSPDGTRLAVAHGDGTLEVVDVAARRPVAAVDTQGAGDLTWHGNDRLFLVAGTSYATYRVGDERLTQLRLRRAEGRLLAVL